LYTREKGVARLQISIYGKNVEISPPLREYLAKRLSKVERHFGAEVTANVTVSGESTGYGAEITIPVNGLLLRAEEKAAGDLYAAIDLVADKLVRQVNRFRKRLQARRQVAGRRLAANEIEAPVAAAEPNGQIVRVKRFALKPMPVEEAVLQMNMLGHDFYVFTNSDTGLVSVLYRRNDGNYGLIEPEP
jgi:putative sigma-54 modulation protein